MIEWILVILVATAEDVTLRGKKGYIQAPRHALGSVRTGVRLNVRVEGVVEYSGITSGQHARATTTVKPTAVAVSARSSQSRAMQQGPQEPQERQPRIHFMIRIGSRLPSLVDGRIKGEDQG